MHRWLTLWTVVIAGSLLAAWQMAAPLPAIVILCTGAILIELDHHAGRILDALHDRPQLRLDPDPAWETYIGRLQAVEESQERQPGPFATREEIDRPRRSRA